MQTIITIETDDQFGCYKAINKLAQNAIIKEVETDDEIWVFDDQTKVKFLFNKDFRDPETGARITIK